MFIQQCALVVEAQPNDKVMRTSRSLIRQGSQDCSCRSSLVTKTSSVQHHHSGAQRTHPWWTDPPEWLQQTQRADQLGLGTWSIGIGLRWGWWWTQALLSIHWLSTSHGHQREMSSLGTEAMASLWEWKRQSKHITPKMRKSLMMHPGQSANFLDEQTVWPWCNWSMGTANFMVPQRKRGCCSACGGQAPQIYFRFMENLHESNDFTRCILQEFFPMLTFSTRDAGTHEGRSSGIIVSRQYWMAFFY